MTARAPVALFVYNRPHHTRRTVEALANNPGAAETVLHVFSDAPRTTKDADAVSAVRRYLPEITGFREIFIHEQAENLGLARSITEGVSSVCGDYGRAIVLEDDLETSPHFLDYMNDALSFYEHTEQVMHVSGCCYPIERFTTHDTYFLQVPLCWGWATWQRAWSSFRKDISVMKRFDVRMRKHFDFDNTHTYWMQLEWNRLGKLNTWFVFWYANVVLSGGLCLFPSRSLVRNIGFDNSGTHGTNTTNYDVNITSTPVKIKPIPLVESKEAFDKHKKYFRRLRPALPMRVFRRMCSALALR
jgi:hypothetical protein